MTVLGIDGKRRCFGGQVGKEFYGQYHDNEWATPLHDDQRLFEMLILEGAQAGLSWETILKRRGAYRQAFHQFDLLKVARMEDGELEALYRHGEIIRNKLKIYSARKNAQVCLHLQEEFGSLDNYFWSFVGRQPLVNHRKNWKDIPTTSPESIALSNDLKKRGMVFVGPTIMYAFMQAVGLVNDHLLDCWICHQR